MHKILADTCVWLDLVKDPEQLKILHIIEELIDRQELSLIVPRVVIDEFIRNKPRIIKESGKSLSGILKRTKDFIELHGDPKKKKAVLEQLNEVDYKIPSLGDAVADSFKRIEKLINDTTIVEVTDDVILRAAQRAIDKRAPFHHQKNSINDAIIMEMYADSIQDNNSDGVLFAFVTHNKSDFSMPNGNDKIPHPDFAMCFNQNKSKYYIKLAEAIQKINPDLVKEFDIEDEWVNEPRSFTEIQEAEEEFFDRIWYDRSLFSQANIKEGLEGTLPPDIKRGMLDARKRVEAKYGGKKAMSKYYKNDFEWGMMNGKLSALRWVLGDEWDNLDT